MAYLYGDSTESPLEFNYIEFLRDALDFAVEILVADHRVQGLQRGVDERKRLAESELDQLRQLSERVMRSLDDPAGGPEAPAGRCAGMIRQSADDAIRRTAAQIKQSVSDYQLQVNSQVQRERASSMHALEMLLRHRDLPDSAQQVELTLDKARTGYQAQTRGKSDLGVDWVQSLDIPAGHMLAQVIKVERLSPGLEIRVPEKGGWMRKGMRLRSHRIAGEYITEVLRTSLQTTIKLRTNPEEDDSGYNLLITPVEPRIRLVRVQKGGEHSPPFEPADSDVPLFLELASQLTDALYELVSSRGPLLEARLDGTPLASHENPPLLVKRLIAKMSPAVQEIARHSLAPDELVLKRVLADDRREEIFASKADLLGKLDPVPLSLRGVFAPLGLGDLGTGAVSGAAAGASAGPPPAPLPGGLVSAISRASGSIPPPARVDTVEPDAETKEIRIEDGGAGGARRAGRESAAPGAAQSAKSGKSSKAGEVQGSSPRPGNNGRSTAPQGSVGLAATAAATATAAALSGGRRSPGPSKPPPPGTQPGFGTHPPPVTLVPRPADDDRAASSAAAAGERARRESAAAAPPGGAASGRAHSHNDDEDVTIVAEANGSRGTNGVQGEDSIDVALGELEAETTESH